MDNSWYEQDKIRLPPRVIEENLHFLVRKSETNDGFLPSAQVW